jgi:hypothetical protein
VINHRRLAQERDGFMEGLSKTFYGHDVDNVLSWSLQDIISGVRVHSPADTLRTTAKLGHSTGADLSDGSMGLVCAVNSTAGSVRDDATRNWHDSTAPIVDADVEDVVPEQRRCQVRAYVVLINGALYLYSTYEVRLPAWDASLDTLLATEHVMYCGAAAEARKDDAQREAPDDSCGKGNIPAHDSDNTAVPAGEDAAAEQPHTPTWSYDLENTYCGTARARPYNECRNKGCTERYLLSELPQLLGSETAVTECMVGLCSRLKPVLLHRYALSAAQKAGDSVGSRPELSHVFDCAAIRAVLAGAATEPVASSTADTSAASAPGAPQLSEVAIIGADLVLTCNDGAYTAHIVEVNNNPAMPAETGKHMSTRYRERLKQMVAAIMQVAIHHGDGHDGVNNGELPAKLGFMRI